MRTWMGLLFFVTVLLLAGRGDPWGGEKDSPSGAASSPPAASGKPAAKPSPASQPAAKRPKVLLLEDDAAPGQAEPKMADNSRCQVCHMNLIHERLVVIHAKEKIGCAKCHGECDAHIDDESWASGGNGTAPDVIYPLAKINKFCVICHAQDKNDASLKCPSPTLKEKKVCTDCHGKHRLVNRKCKWK